MNDQPSTTRRRLLVTTGGLVSLGLAGCVSGAQQTIQAGGGQPEEAHSEEAGSHEVTGTESETFDPQRQTVDAHHGDPQAHEDDGHGLPGPREQATVEMITNDSGYHFHPHVTWVEVGGTVTFKNVSGAHSAAAYHPDNDRSLRIPEGAASFDSGLLSEAGATYEHRFETEGVYDIYCAPHEALGMIGSVIVGEPDPHDQPGLGAPQSDMSETVSTKITSLNHTVNEALGHTHDEQEPTSTDTDDHHDEEDGHQGDDEDTESGHHDEEETGHHGDDEDTASGHDDGESESGHSH